MKKDLLKIIGEVYDSPVVSSEEFYEKIEEWYTWYRGKVDRFHSYSQFNGIVKVKRERKNLNMARVACSDKANYEMNEKVEITINDGAAQEFFDSVLFQNNFKVKSNELVELANALGTGAFIQDIVNNYLGTKIELQYIMGNMIFPLHVVNGIIIDCAFVSEDKVDGKAVYDISVYRRFTDRLIEDLDEEDTELLRDVELGTYVLMNYKCKYNGNKLSFTDIDEETPRIFAFNTFSAPFQIIRPAIANNYDPHNGMGISLFANAIDTLMSIDTAYDSYTNEFIAGKKRIFIHDDLIMSKKSGDSNTKFEVFDDNDFEFYGMDFPEGTEPIKEVNMSLRTAEHQTGINDFLNLYSMLVGFGQNFYKFTNGTVQKTATEVSSDNTEMFATVGKDELILEKALIDMAFSILEMGNNFIEGENFNMDNIEVTVNFDDSIFEDDAEIRKIALLEFGAGVIDEVEYNMRVYKLSEEEAIKKVEKMRARMPQTGTLVGE